MAADPTPTAPAPAPAPRLLAPFSLLASFPRVKPVAWPVAGIAPAALPGVLAAFPWGIWGVFGVYMGCLEVFRGV
jgi:hypothetical protein